MSRALVVGLIVMVGGAGGCAGNRAPAPAVAASAAAPPAAEPPAMVTGAPTDEDLAAATAARLAWLAEVEGYVADPATIPRLADPAGRARFERLVSDPAWLDVAPATFGYDRDQVLLRFFPAVKALSMTLWRLHAADEDALLGLYSDGMYRAMIGAAAEMVAALPATDTSRATREAGIERMRIGAAMTLCASLAATPRLSAPVAQRVLDHLADATTYGGHSATSLQLFLATIDERMQPGASATRRRALDAVRAVVARAHAARVAVEPAATRIYEGLDLTTGVVARTVTSHSGGFAATVGLGALVWREDGGRAGQVHRLEWRDGAVLFEVICFDHASLDTVVASMIAAGARERSGHAGGRWLMSASATAEGGQRIDTISGRACVAGVEAPPGQLTVDRIDALLGSLRAAP